MRPFPSITFKDLEELIAPSLICFAQVHTCHSNQKYFPFSFFLGRGKHTRTCGSSRGPFGAADAAYTAACGNAGSLTHWARPGIKLESSWILVRFLTHLVTVGTLFPCFLKSAFSSRLWLGCHKWPQNSILSSLSSLSSLLEVEVQGLPLPGRWFPWSPFSAVPAITLEQNPDVMVFHRPHLSWDACEVVWRSSNALYVQKGMNCPTLH